MIKRAKRGLVFSAYLQIILLVSMSFAVAFLLSSSFVKAENMNNLIDVPYTPPSMTPYTDMANNLFSTGATTQPSLMITPNGATPRPLPDGVLAKPPVYNPEHPIKSALGGQGFGASGVGGALIAGVAWAGVAYIAVKLIGSLIGLNKGAQRALELSVTSGAFVTGTLKAMVTNQVSTFSPGGSLSYLGAHPYATGLIFAAVIFIALYKQTSKKLVNFQCLPFEPPSGGAKCEECNKYPFRTCSEYRCRSLGQACQLLNAGTKEEQCAWVSRNDVKSPTISPWTFALKPDGLKYTPDTAIRPPAIGTKIVSGSNACLSAFTPLQFGIATDEPAQCKVDYNHTTKFDNMQYYFGDSNYYQYNHTQKMRLPGPNTGNNSGPELANDGNFALYTRCRDANGNENVDEYVFSFCVDKGPDTTPPVIEEFSIPSNSYVAHNQDNVPIEVYVNEPSECKWSSESKTYEDMENPMRCFTESYQINANLQYTCAGNLTGVKNSEDNKYYFRCKDQPSNPENERNVNVQSKELIIKGSQPLNIISTAPTGIVSGSTDVVSVNLAVETDDGAESGKAVCYFSPTGAKDTYITMFETNNFAHKQLLSLTTGEYKYYFRCIDSGGNAAEANTTFSVFVDNQAPKVTRVYKQDALKIVTDENAECTYSLQNCNFNFNDGIKMIYSNVDIKNNLFAEWKASSTYYIKCRDKYGNEPEPNKCSITAGAIELKGSA